MSYSKEFIQKTLDFWQPKYDAVGVKLTEEDAREIIENTVALFDLLDELDRKYNKCQKNAS